MGNQNRAAWGFDEDNWELYDLENDRFQERGLARAGLTVDRTKFRFYPGAVRLDEMAAPSTINRSWAMNAYVEIPPGGAEGPIVGMGGDMNGWSLYLKNRKPVYCYNLAAIEYTYIRSDRELTPGLHEIRYEFEQRGKELFGAGGVGRLFVDGQRVAEGQIPNTVAYAYSLDETFDVGCDKGAPVTNEYPAMASFTGKIIRVDVDLEPRFAHDVEAETRAKFHAALLRE